MSTFDGSRSLSSSSCRTSLPVFAVPPQSDSVSSTRPREEWVAYSFERFIAAIKTRYTPHPDDMYMYSPTRQPAKRCREQSLWRQPTAEVERAACAEIDMARRPSSRTMPLARRREPAARWRAPRLGAAEVRRLHHSRTTPAPLPRGSGAPHMKTGRGCAFRMRSGAVPRAGHAFLSFSKTIFA